MSYLTNPYMVVPTGSSIGGWKEIGRVDPLTSSGDTMTASGVASKPYMLNLGFVVATGDVNSSIRMGNGSIAVGTEYAYRNIENYGTTMVDANTQNQIVSQAIADTNTQFQASWVNNYDAVEKSTITWSNGCGTSASDEPIITNSSGKWSNTSNVADEFQMFNSDTGSFDNDSEMVLLGYDGSDDDTGGFFEELADSGLATGSDRDLDSGTFDPKKFLFFELSGMGNSTGNTKEFRFNGNSDGVYSWNGQEDSAGSVTGNTQTQTQIGQDQNVQTNNVGFIYNNANYQKIGMNWGVKSNAPNIGQCMFCFKWAETSNPITSIQFRAENQLIASGSSLRVWGSD